MATIILEEKFEQIKGAALGIIALLALTILGCGTDVKPSAISGIFSRT